MSSEQGKTKTSRRAFLRDLAAMGGVAAVATTAVSGQATAAGAAPKVAPKGYRVTPHVAKYYDKARI